LATYRSESRCRRHNGLLKLSCTQAESLGSNSGRTNGVGDS
jgi:hypothetical protein